MEWYYADAFENQHAVSSADLPGLVATGAVTRETLVWNGTMDTWQPAGEVCADWFPSQTPPDLTSSQRRQAVHALAVPFAGQRVPLDALAVISLVLGCLGIIGCGGPILSLPGVVCGHIARRRTKGETLPSSNGGLALAGLIVGYIGLVLSLVVIVFYAVVIVLGTMAGAEEGGGGTP